MLSDIILDEYTQAGSKINFLQNLPILDPLSRWFINPSSEAPRIQTVAVIGVFIAVLIAIVYLSVRF